MGLQMNVKKTSTARDSQHEAELERGLRESLSCPLTKRILVDPVLIVGTEGVSYEREALEARFAAGDHTHPETGAPLADRRLVPNAALRGLIAGLLVRYPALRAYCY